jgi:hypothetical protein
MVASVVAVGTPAGVQLAAVNQSVETLPFQPASTIGTTYCTLNDAVELPLAAASWAALAATFTVTAPPAAGVTSKV